MLQTTQPGNTSDSLLAVLLLMQAKSMELQARRCGTLEKWLREPCATTRTFGYLALEISVQMVAALMLDFLPALQWVAHLSDGRPVLCRMLFGHQKKHPKTVRFLDEGGSETRNYSMWTSWIILYLSAGVS